MTPPAPDRLILFLKAPRVGEVKTRLGSELGMEAARGIYTRLLDILIAKLAIFPNVEFRLSPDNAEPEITQWLRPSWTVRGQGPGDLTQRLMRAFGDSFREKTERVVVIGSDCPDVSAQDVREAWEALREFDAVIGPATDGGYWLIGLRKEAPYLFEGIPWSSERVLERTLEIAKREGLRIKLLRTLSDIDTKADWERFQRDSPES